MTPDDLESIAYLRSLPLGHLDQEQADTLNRLEREQAWDALTARAEAAEAALRERDAEIERLKARRAFGAESRRLLEEEVLPIIEADTPSEPTTEHDLRKVSLIGAIRAHLAGGEPAGSSISPYDPEAVAKALAGGER